MSSGGAAYHRNDLRGELLRGAHGFVSLHGHDTLSMRALAQVTGVSAGAPYHHFADRRSLLLAMALDGFDRLLDLGHRVVAAELGGRAGLEALARAFLRFQHDHPRLMELMYESELTRPKIDDEIAARQRQGFELVAVAIAKALPGVAVADIERRGVVFWSSIYGFASLLGKQLLSPFLVDDPGLLADWEASAVRSAAQAAIAPD